MDWIRGRFFLDWKDTEEVVDEEIRTFMYSLAH
jgi:hypothetical protein